MIGNLRLGGYRWELGRTRQACLSAGQLARTPIAVLPDETTAVPYKTVRIREVDIFYREAGSATVPVLLLLHSFPASSSMFRNVIRHLARSFRVVAPDDPGYGFCSMPDHKSFAYSFDSLSDLMLESTAKLNLSRFIVDLFDYSEPIALRKALKEPDKIAGMIVQNGNA
jgi:pimeloyl-ACP methyl ester carboxylesterase